MSLVPWFLSFIQQEEEDILLLFWLQLGPAFVLLKQLIWGWGKTACSELLALTLLASGFGLICIAFCLSINILHGVHPSDRRGYLELRVCRISRLKYT
jgi:uncharacterized membrane protein YbhN (UPF0104 family)